MLILTPKQRETRNRIEELRDQLSAIEIQIGAYQKVCDHYFTNYPNPDVEVKYCVICGHEEYK